MWQLQTTNTFAQFEDVWAASATQVLAVGTDPVTNQGVAYQYNGSTWQRTTLASSGSLKSLWGTSFSNVIAGGRGAPNYFAATNNGAMYHFNGTAFSPMTMPAHAGAAYGLWGLSASQLYAVDYSGGVFRYNGTQWARLSEGVSDAYFNALHGVATRLVAVGPSGVVMMTR